jgi:hypothetical protein
VTRLFGVVFSISVIVAALVFAAARFEGSGGGAYSVDFLALRFLAVIGVVGVAASLIDAIRNASGMSVAVAMSVGTAAVLVVLGVAAGFRG